MSGTNSSINNTLKLPLKGLVTSTNSAITSTDRVIDAFGKLQAQITSVNTGTGKLSANQTWSGVNTFSAANNSFTNALGIGTATPLAKLVVSNDGATGIEINPTSGVVNATYYNRTGSSYVSSRSIANSFSWQSGVSPVDRMILDQNGNLGLATTAPTHSLTLSSTSTGWTHYKTSDQTTNFERVRSYWSGNNYFFGSEKGGTGTVRGFGFATNGVEQGRLFPTGNWFLGSSPVDSGFKLDVNGTARVQGDISGAGKLFFTTNTTFSSNPLVGVISKQSDHGLILAGATGTTNDFALGTPSGQLLLVNPTGTNNISFAPASGGNVLVGTTTNIPSSILTLSSTTKGFLLPRMTATQRTAISSPAVGLMVYQTDATEGLYIFKSTGWALIG